MQQSIQAYIEFLSYEKNLSVNTRKNYQRDLKQASDYLSRQHVSSWQKTVSHHVLDFVAFKKEAGTV